MYIYIFDSCVDAHISEEAQTLADGSVSRIRKAREMLSRIKRTARVCKMRTTAVNHLRIVVTATAACAHEI